MLPGDAFILLSFVNTKLRDQYDSLSDFCEGEDADETDLLDKLRRIGFTYNEELNRFC